MSVSATGTLQEAFDHLEAGIDASHQGRRADAIRHFVAARDRLETLGRDSLAARAANAISSGAADAAGRHEAREALQLLVAEPGVEGGNA